MKLVFHHEDFDRDVSSGTSHALSQWMELCSAFDVTDVIIINKTPDKLVYPNQEINVQTLPSLKYFLLLEEPYIFVEQGGHPCYSSLDYKGEWLVFGGHRGLPMIEGTKYVTIKTPVALYPREAAAVVMSNIWLTSL